MGFPPVCKIATGKPASSPKVPLFPDLENIGLTAAGAFSVQMESERGFLLRRVFLARTGFHFVGKRSIRQTPFPNDRLA
jgi:hypothetical protein